MAGEHFNSLKTKCYRTKSPTLNLQKLLDVKYYKYSMEHLRSASPCNPPQRLAE